MPRFRLPILVAVLSLAALTAGAAVAAPAAGQPAAPTVAGPLSASGAPELCQAKATLLPVPQLQPPALKLTYTATCGTCSDSICRGATVNEVCAEKGGAIYVCVPPLGNNCSDGVTWQCQCWYGPLP